MIFAPRSCPSSPGFATTILIFLAVSVGTIGGRGSFDPDLTVVEREGSTVFRRGIPIRECVSDRDISLGGIAVYDVLFLDRAHREKILASGLGREAACELARVESRRRGVGRMFLAGSEPGPVSDLVVIVESHRRAA